MKVYISLLRGINVSGQKLIKMDALRKSYEGLGLKHVHSYVQSGNLLFSVENTDPGKLEARIRGMIEQEYGFDVPVQVLTAEYLEKVVDANPFAKDESKDSSFFHLTFLSEIPGSIDVENIESKKLPGEEIVIHDKVIYLYCPNGYGKTKLNNNFLEAKCKVGATTRNWKTSNELLRIAGEMGARS